MDEKKNLPDVPYLVHEEDMVKLERSNRRLLIALAIALVVMFLNNAAWLIHEHVDNTAQEITSEIEP